ncbi:sporulation integral membrane protein YtvI [Clostridium sp. Marseille-P3244]|uniref:sporulation integral membrane protein YtvI n=1 Tax=Clostridium sp. Marseille-P3244 TaxID=1871020 RepID=UPI00092FDFC5|nr:sporulation integral membrane protein YtvI [Clostridium sp. Marseille-P3244]
MENRRPYWQVGLRLLFSLLATAAFVIIGVKLIGFLMPFVIGWIISAIAAPLVNWLEKRLRIVKKLGSALIVILVLAVIVLALYFGISRLISEISGLIRNFPEMYAQLETGLGQIGETLSGIFDRLPTGIQHGWNTVAENLDNYMGNLVSGISEPTVTAAGNIAKRVPYYLISFIVAVMSAYFFIVQREEVLGWMRRIAPESVQKRMTLVMDNLKYAVGGYFKAQFKIMAIVFLILVVGLGFLGVGYFVLIALLIAFLDFLPFFGTGTAMIPWAVYQFFMGDYKMTAALVVIYVVTQVVRQLLQPKLVGDSVGLNPLVTLILLYVGYRMGGILWMILAVPIGMVLINMCQAGAFNYIFDDVRILVEGILGLQEKGNEEDDKS